MITIDTVYVGVAFIIAILGSYTVGYHQGEVDKHKEIFDLILGSNWKEARESEIRNRGI